MLFGAFLLFLFTRCCPCGSPASVPAMSGPGSGDVIGIAVGLLLAVGVMHGHRWLFGVAIA